MITMPASLETDRLYLRAPRAADTTAVMAFAGHVEATRYMVWPRAETQDDVESFLEDVAWGWSQGDDFTYVVTARELSDAVIGMASCQFSDDGAELGFILHPDGWGQGLATEAAGAVMQAARAIDDLYRIWAVCDPDNQASVAVLERLGLTYEGRMRRRSHRPNLTPQNGPRDDLLYAWVR